MADSTPIKLIDLDNLSSYHSLIDEKKQDKVTGKGLSTNDFTDAYKNKLDGIETGAEVNQNAFGNIAVGSTTMVADGETDTLTLTEGNNITLTPEADTNTITITAEDTTYTFANGTNGFTVTPSNGSAQTVTVTPSITNATTSSDGLMSSSDKTKLDGIAAGAEVNLRK